jgi:transcription initiation factor IIE alpha subunit
MTRSCCPGCRLRFSAATAHETATCPFCGEPLAQLPAESVVGLQLMAIERLDGECERQVAARLAAAFASTSASRHPPAPRR